MSRRIIVHGILTAILVFNHWHAAAQLPPQEHVLDSLRRIVAAPSSPDSQKLKALLALGAESSLSPDRLKDYGSQAFELAYRLGDSVSRGLAARHIGVGYALTERFDIALKWTLIALRLAKDYDTEERYLKALINLNGIYFELEDWEKATGISRELIERAKAAETFSVLAASYEALGITLNRMGELDSAEHYLRRAIHLYCETDASVAQQANCFNSLADTYIKNKQYSEAKKVIQEANSLFQQLDSNQGPRLSLVSKLGEVQLYLALGQYATAENKLKSAQKIALDRNLTTFLPDIYFFRSRIDSLQGDHQKALIWLHLHLRLHDSLTKESNERYVTSLLSESELDREKLENDRLRMEQELSHAELETRNLLLIGTSLGLVFLVIFIFLLIRKNALIRQKNEQLGITSQIIEQKNSHLLEHQALLMEQKAELSSLNETKDRWFGIISHDFRHPLTVLQGALDIMDSEEITDQERMMLIKDLQKRFMRTSNLLDNLLYWAQNQLSGWKINPEWISFRQMVAPVLDLADMVAWEKGVSIRRVFTPEMKIFADTEAIRLIIRNLLDNAIKYSHPGQEVILEARDVETGWIIRVVDQGIGMDPAQLQQLPHRNSQSSLGTNGERGSGLGLVISYDFAKFINAELIPYSHPGQGTTFELKLYHPSYRPLAQTPEEA